MIFIALGTQKFQFNRLLKMIDELVISGVIEDEIIAQSGYSTYHPQTFKTLNFINQNDYKKYIQECNIFITHGGVGSIIEGLENEKKIIIVPRLHEYGEHIDNHQLDITNKYYDLGFCLYALNKKELEVALKNSNDFISKYSFISKTNNIVNSITKYVDTEWKND